MTRIKAANVAATFCIVVLAFLYWKSLPFRPADELEKPLIRSQPLQLFAIRGLQSDRVVRERVKASLNRLGALDYRNWSSYLHVIRLLGAQKDKELAGRKLRDVVGPLFDDGKAIKEFNARIHMPTNHGFCFEGSDAIDRQGESHWCQTLATLAELSVETDRVVRIAEQDYQIKDAVRNAMWEFNWQQAPEWGVVAFCHYVPTKKSWANKYGQPIDLDAICSHLCQAPLGDGPCFGTHTLYGLAVLVRTDELLPVLSELSRKRALGRLKEGLELLMQNQRLDGSWGSNWATQTDAGDRSIVRDIKKGVRVTGHSLEWLFVASSQLKVDDAVIDRAAEYLVNQILNASDADLNSDNCGWSHAGTALARWYQQ